MNLFSTVYEQLSQYQALIAWYESKEKQANPDELRTFFSETRGRFERNKKILWEDIQRKIGLFFSTKSLTDFVFESFMDILNNTVKLVNIGEEFLIGSSPILRTVVRQTSLSYFTNFHNKRIDELLTLLPNEIWRTCPVPPNFSIMHLTEFQFFAASRDSGSGNDSSTALKLENNPFSNQKRLAADNTTGSPTKPIIEASTRALASSGK